MFPVHPLSTPWKHQKTETSGNSKILWCFQEVETGCIGNKWIKTKLNIKWVDLSTTSPVDTKRKLNVLCTFNLCPVPTGSALKNSIQRYQNSFFLLISNSRSSHPEVFLMKDVLKKCSKFTGEHLFLGSPLGGCFCNSYWRARVEICLALTSILLEKKNLFEDLLLFKRK